MSEPNATPPAPASPPITPPTPASPPTTPLVARPSAGQRMFGCFGRFISALLVIVITTAITLAAVAYAAMSLGYTAQTPATLNNAQGRVATLEAENSSLRAENIAVQTQLAGMIRQSGNDREQVDGIREQVAGFADIGSEVATRLAADTRERATVATEMRQNRDAVQLFATAEAGRAAQIDDLQRRSDRVERFLFRLGDIANDAAADISNATPTAAAVLSDTPTLAPILTDTPTPSPALTPIPTSGSRATATEATPTPDVTSTVNPSVTPTVIPTTTPSPAPTRRP